MSSRLLSMKFMQRSKPALAANNDTNNNNITTTTTTTNNHTENDNEKPNTSIDNSTFESMSIISPINSNQSDSRTLYDNEKSPPSTSEASFSPWTLNAELSKKLQNMKRRVEYVSWFSQATNNMTQNARRFYGVAPPSSDNKDGTDASKQSIRHKKRQERDHELAQQNSEDANDNDDYDDYEQNDSTSSTNGNNKKKGEKELLKMARDKGRIGSRKERKNMTVSERKMLFKERRKDFEGDSDSSVGFVEKRIGSRKRRRLRKEARNKGKA